MIHTSIHTGSSKEAYAYVDTNQQPLTWQLCSTTDSSESWNDWLKHAMDPAPSSFFILCPCYQSCFLPDGLQTSRSLLLNWLMKSQLILLAMLARHSSILSQLEKLRIRQSLNASKVCTQNHWEYPTDPLTKVLSCPIKGSPSWWSNIHLGITYFLILIVPILVAALPSVDCNVNPYKNFHLHWDLFPRHLLNDSYGRRRSLH